MTNLRNAFLLIIFSVLLSANAYSQTYLYGKVGIGKTEIKKFETSTDTNLGNTFLPHYNSEYEIGIIRNLNNKFSLKAGGGFSLYSCTVGLAEWDVPSSDDYYDKLNKFYYLSFPIGIRYNPIWDFRIEAGVINNIFVKHTYQELQFFYNIKKYTAVPYWGINYTFFDKVEVGFIDHLYLSHFANYSNWYDQTNGIEPSIFFKYNVWKVYVSYRIELSKHDK